ncbi:MAG: hypothetical protein OEQ29_13635 [Alphaproteobacteria bacterium]|nr:hypothetical protein [Alphaproteobacteria bacterium]
MAQQNRVQAIRLPAATPRRIDGIKRQIDLRRGLYTGYVFGGVFLGGAALLPLGVVLMPGPSGGPLFFPLIFGPLLFAGFALLFLLPARRRYRARVDAFVNGTLVTARVTGHRRAWVAYSSFRDYLIDAEARLTDGRMATGTIRTRKAREADALPTGTELQALALPASASLFLPTEIGAEIVQE